MADLATLQQRLGYQFRDENLLRLALTHPSVAHESGTATTHNQRLEFLGDAVLGLVLSHELYDKFPGSDEGSLTKSRAKTGPPDGIVPGTTDYDGGKASFHWLRKAASSGSGMWIL